MLSCWRKDNGVCVRSAVLCDNRGNRSVANPSGCWGARRIPSTRTSLANTCVGFIGTVLELGAKETQLDNCNRFSGFPDGALFEQGGEATTVGVEHLTSARC